MPKKTTAAITTLIIFALLIGISTSQAKLTNECEIAKNIDSTSPSISTEQSDLSEWQKQLQQLQLNEWQKQLQELAELAETLKTQSVKIGIAYGVEKEKWLQQAEKNFNGWVREKFKQAQLNILDKNTGDIINIELIHLGSIEGAKTILKQDSEAKLIHVWIPASSLVRDLLVEPWKKQNNCDPILSGTPLVYTPLVILMWKERYKKFIAKYQYVDFNTIAQALSERTGWAAIADKPEWGIFTFGHTVPTHSNSGLLTLVLMAYNYYLSKPELEDDKEIKEIKLEQIQNDSFLAWLKSAQKNIWTDPSTNKLIKAMLDLEPSEVESIIIYENLALEKLNAEQEKEENQKKAKKANPDEKYPDNKEEPNRELKIIYPTLNIWNDNPYYILNVPWSSPAQRIAAKLFQEFLLSESAQKVARDCYSFRPANSNIPLLEKNNLFDKFQNRVQIKLHKVPNPKAEVLEQLLKIWESTENREIITD